MVGLEEGSQRVYDDVGVVQLCAVVTRPNINCPITFTFSLMIVTTDGSAGIIIIYSKTSISGPSKERTPPLERTDQLPLIVTYLILIHLKPPKAELRTVDTRGVTNIAQHVQICLRKRTSSAAPTINIIYVFILRPYARF